MASKGRGGRLGWLIPQEKQFFDMIEEHSETVLRGAEAFNDMLQHYENLDEKRKKIKQLERECDGMVHGIHEELNRTFITPIDREDITALINALDDILDYIYAVSERLVLYNIQQPTDFLKNMSKTLLRAVKNLNDGIRLLRNFKNAEKIREFCTVVNSMENQGDMILRRAMGDLFRKTDPIEIIKYKELYDTLEVAIDKCEDAADVMGNILVKYT